MPLPQLAGDDAAVMGGPGMAQPPSPFGEDSSQDVTTQDQMRGAVEQLSKLRSSNRDTLDAIATQFPNSSKTLKSLQQMLDQGVQAIIKDLLRTTEAPEPTPPRVIR